MLRKVFQALITITKDLNKESILQEIQKRVFSNSNEHLSARIIGNHIQLALRTSDFSFKSSYKTLESLKNEQTFKEFQKAEKAKLEKFLADKLNPKCFSLDICLKSPVFGFRKGYLYITSKEKQDDKLSSLLSEKLESKPEDLEIQLLELDRYKLQKLGNSEKYIYQISFEDYGEKEDEEKFLRKFIYAVAPFGFNFHSVKRFTTFNSSVFFRQELDYEETIALMEEKEDSISTGKSNDESESFQKKVKGKTIYLDPEELEDLGNGLYWDQLTYKIYSTEDLCIHNGSNCFASNVLDTIFWSGQNKYWDEL